MRRFALIPTVALILLVGACATAASKPASEAPPQPPMQVQAVEEVVQDTPTVSDPAPSVSSDDGSPLPPMEKPDLQYPNLGYALDQMVAETKTEGSSSQKTKGDAANSKPEPVAVSIYLSGHVDDVATFLEDNGGDPRNVGEGYIEAYVPVAVSIYLSGHVDDVATFLEDNGGDPRNVGEGYIEAYVPVTLLSELSGQPGVLRVREIIPQMPP